MPVSEITNIWLICKYPMGPITSFNFNWLSSSPEADWSIWKERKTNRELFLVSRCLYNCCKSCDKGSRLCKLLWSSINVSIHYQQCQYLKSQIYGLFNWVSSSPEIDRSIWKERKTNQELFLVSRCQYTCCESCDQGSHWCLCGEAVIVRPLKSHFKEQESSLCIPGNVYQILYRNF